MHTRRGMLAAPLVVVLCTTMTIGSFDAATPAVVTRYAIRDARIVTMAGPLIDKGTVLMRDGLIEEVGPSVVVPTDAIVIDGAGLTVYPGFIDMANAAAVETPEPAAAGARAGGAPPPTLAELERTRRGLLLRPDFEAARYARVEGTAMRRIASAGITSVLAVPTSGLVRGQSALVNVMAPPESPQISSLADYRRGLVVVKSPVAQHVGFSSGGGRGGGGAYPGALLGTIAFVRQAFYDARWQREARAYYEKHGDQPRPVMEPVLDALAPVLDRRMPAAFDADLAVEIARALGLAKEFSLDPIIVGGAESGDVAADIKAAGGRVIFSLNFPTAPERGRGGGRAGGRGAAPGDEPIRTIRARQNAPKGPAALSKAGVSFAFTSGGLQDLSLVLRNAARAVKEGGLAADAALAALTSEAAKIAGVENRLGTLQRNRIANLVVTDGDWTEEQTRIRHVFIDGRPVDIDSAPATPAAGGGRRGGRGGPGRD